MNGDVEVWVRELEAAGWKRYGKGYGLNIWKSPTGALFRGPYRAWTIMKGMCPT